MHFLPTDTTHLTFSNRLTLLRIVREKAQSQQRPVAWVTTMYHLFVYLPILLTQDRLRCAALFDDCCWLRFMADDVAPVHSVLLGGAVATELCLCFSTGSHSSSYLAGTSATNSVVPPCRHEVTARLIFLISRAISTLLLLLAASDAATRSI